MKAYKSFALFPVVRLYTGFFRLRFVAGLQYRAAAWAGVATQFGWGFMRLTLLNAFVNMGTAASPMSAGQLASYIWLQQAFLAVYAMWRWESELLESVSTGHIGYELCRPVSLYAMWSIRAAAGRLSAAALRCGPIILVAALLPGDWRLQAPVSLSAAAGCVVSMLMGMLVAVFLGMFVYISGFYMLNTLGLRLLTIGISEFLMGGVIPLPFLPKPVLVWVNLLPFASMQNTPLLIYSGQITGKETLIALGLQLFWVVTLGFTGSLWMRHSLKRLVIQG